MSTATQLPRLLYVADVPVESSYHGSALIYRLFQTYPKERLRILEAGLKASEPQRRLVGVAYSAALQSGQRWLSTRLHHWISSLFSIRAQWKHRVIEKSLAGFNPEAVLTVAHGYSWITAANFARRNALPLHLIVHDDWPRMVRAVLPVRSWVERQFARCYRDATSRLCVSTFMVEEYHRRYGVTGTVLYPSRAADVPKFPSPPERLLETSRPLVFGFGGTINTVGHAQALRELAAALEGIDGRLNLYGPINKAEADRSGLLRANVKLCGLVPAAEFIPRIREEVDVLFAPMSFAPANRANMSLCFPSKLTDYTAAGLPILIYGPDYSSAVRWARDNPGVAEVVDDCSAAEITSALKRLQCPAHRMAMGRTALSIGNKCFEHLEVSETFQRTIKAQAP